MGRFIVRPVLKLLSLPYSAAEAISSSCVGRKNTAKVIRRRLKAFLQALLLNEDEPGVFLGHIPFCGCVFSPCAHGECEFKKKKKKKAVDLIK